MRKRYSPSFKAESVLEVLKEDQTLNQIASTRAVHPNQLSQWKTQAIQNLHKLFEPDQQATRTLEEAHAREVEKLYAEIGRLTTQVNWLKKKSGLDPNPK